MSTWTAGELDGLGETDELEVAALRRDGTLRPARIVWMVRVGDDVYVRSVNGRDGRWYQGVQARPEGRVRFGRVARDVSFVAADPAVNEAVDAAYRARYRRYPSPVDSITGERARATTLRLVPR